MTNCNNTSTSRPGRWDHRLYPGLPGQIRIQPRDLDGNPVPHATVQARIDTTTFDAVPDGDDWIVTLTWPTPAVLPLTLLLDGVVATTGTVQVGRVGECDPSTDSVTVTTAADTVLNVTVLGTGGPGGGGSPPQAGDGIDVAGYTVSVDPTVVRTDDPRLSDARQPLPHTHPASDITGLPAVPALTTDPAEALGAAAAGVSVEAARADHVHPMPDATDVGADPVGTAAGLVAGIDTGVLEIQEGPGVTVDDTDPARPVVSATGGGGGGGAPDPSGWRPTWTPGVTYPAIPHISASTVNENFASGRAYAAPLIAPASGVIGDLSIDSGASSGTWTVLIYSSRPHAGAGGEEPASPIAVVGQHVNTGSGVVTFTNVALPVSGLVWVVVHSDSSGAIRCWQACHPDIVPPVPGKEYEAGRWSAFSPSGSGDPLDVSSWPDWPVNASRRGRTAPVVWITAGATP